MGIVLPKQCAIQRLGEATQAVNPGQSISMGIYPFELGDMNGVERSLIHSVEFSVTHAIF